MSDPLEELFKKTMEAHNGHSIPSGDSSSSGSDSSGDRPSVSLFPDFEEPTKTSNSNPNVPLHVQKLKEAKDTPVEKSSPEDPRFLPFDYSPSFKENVEVDEEEKPFTTYSEDRSFQRDVISFIERYYYDKGDLPEYSLLHETFHDYPERPRFIKGWKAVVEAVQDRLDARGLPSFRTAEGYLDPLFVSLCTIILNPHDKRSDAAKIKELANSGHNISVEKWNAWMRRKPYREYYQQRAERIFDEELQTEAKRRLGDLVRSGDLTAIKYLDERTGVYRSGSDSTAMVGAIITAMMNILARNVTVDVLSKIGAEMRNEPAIQQLIAIEAQAS